MFQSRSTAEGRTFLSAAPDRGQGLLLMTRLPSVQAGAVPRRGRLSTRAGSSGRPEQSLAVFFVDENGPILRELGQATQ
jgi:hypothetical protein